MILSDYYLADVIDCKIEVCVRFSDQEPVRFVPVQKHISFSTMYAIFDNTNKGYSNKVLDSVYLNEMYELPAELDHKHPTIKFNSFDGTEGEIAVKNIADEEIIADYKLTGWIGIHTSLDEEIQQRNDKTFKKINYHPNAVRLYVRGKLAVDNLMTYINNTQAFSNYIEGEICFDVLDDDRFEDISTSNREGYKKDDVRVKKLLDIVGKIVNKLVHARAAKGSEIKQELRDYLEAKAKEEEEKKKALELELEQSQERESLAIEQQKKAEERVQTERKRMDYIVSVSNIDSNNVLPSMHSVYNLSVLGKKEIAKFKKHFNLIPAKLYSSIEALGEINSQILYISKAVAKSNYLIESEEKDADICDFISEYIGRIAKKIYGSKIKIFVDDELEERLIVKINTVNIVTIIENIIGNSIKSRSKNLNVVYKNEGNKTIITFADDGNGLSEDVENINDIFKFGYTTTSGAGLGLYYSKKYIEEMGGTLSATANSPSGLIIVAEWEQGG